MTDLVHTRDFSPLLDKGLAVLKSNTALVLICVFLASFFYSKSVEYRLLRIISSVFLYISLWRLLVFYNQSPRLRVPLPRLYTTYLLILFSFVIYNFYVDILGSNFDIKTQINNPYGFLASLNILAFGLGIATEKLDSFFKILFFVCVLFVVFCFVPDLPKFEGFHGYICAYAIIPFFILSRHYNKYKLFSYGVLPLAVMFSISSDYRIIILRLLLFFVLFATLSLVKKHNFLKFLILTITCFAVYQFIANLNEVLNFFGRFIKVQGFETDTRSFLYRELFEDLKPNELLTGRGFSGTYFSTFFLSAWSVPDEMGISFIRFTIEVGFLQLILKGGFLYYILFITLPFISCMRGLFKKNVSSLAFAFSILIFTELVLMFVENIPNYGFHFFNLFFISGFVFNENRKVKG